MRLSVLTTVKKLLNRLGARSSGRISELFPTVVSSEYLSVWDEFLTTRAAKDVMKSFPALESRYYLCQAFALLVGSADRNAVLSKGSPLDSLELYNVRPQYSRIYELIGQSLVPALKLRRFHHSFGLEAEDFEFFQAFVDVWCTGKIEYKVQGREPLDKLIHRLAPNTFKHVPVELKSKHKDKERKILKAFDQWQSNENWIVLQDDEFLKLEIARARFSTILVRYSFPCRGIFFYGDRPVTELEKRMKKRHSQFATVP